MDKFRRRQTANIFLLIFFLQKIRFDISYKLSPGDSLHEMSILTFYEKDENISKCRLLISPTMLSVKDPTGCCSMLYGKVLYGSITLLLILVNDRDV